MAVTINDIARTLRISKGTVSKALNGYGDVSLETRQIVEQTALAMGYQPSAIARSLSLGRTNNIALLLNASVAYVLDYLSGMLSGAVAAADAAGRQLILHPMSSSELEPVLNASRTREYDGVILFAPNYPEGLFDTLTRQRLAFVVMGKRIPHRQVSYLVPDYYSGSYQATRHLIEAGHRRIAMMSRPHIRITNEERLQGYYDALHDAGLPRDEALVYETSAQAGSGAEATRCFLRLEDRPTALCAFHDLLAAEALATLHEAGLRVPQDMSLVGFDGLRTSQITRPPLTTVQQPFDYIGRRVVEMILQQLDGPACPPAQETVPVELIVRESTSPIGMS